MLTGRTIVATPTISVHEVHCSHEPAGWSAPEPVLRATLVLIRSGLFRRRVGRRETVLDATSGYLPRPGTEEAFAHPLGGDWCTSINVTDEALTGLLQARSNPDLPVTPVTDIAHRALLARARCGGSTDELAERAHLLVGAVLDVDDPAPSRPDRPQRVVDQVRELFAADPVMPLADLAEYTGLSVYYLSRVFRRTAGCTITAYRIRLRLRHALDRLASGQTDLAAVAADTGFSDQAHLTRMLRREAGATPGAVRRLFTTGE